MRAIHLTGFGNPVESLQFVQIPEPPAPGPGQVLIGVEFSPIDLSDLLIVRGTYPLRPSLPSVIGNEGVGRILAVGPGVETVTVGDRVLTPLYGFAWAERIVVPAEGLFALPADVDPQQLAMLTINPPTAALLLIVDAPEGLNSVKAALGTAAPRLAIDGVGGPSAATLINLLGRDSTVVAYAALGKAPIPISAIALIFKRISVRGFFLSDPERAAKIRPVVVDAVELLRSGRLYAPVAATY